jgi:hypothetical protein
MWIFFIFQSGKIRVNPTGVIASLSPPRCHPSSGQRRHVAAPCHAAFSWSQDEPIASASSSGNVSSHRLPSRTEFEALNPYHTTGYPHQTVWLPPFTAIKYHLNFGRSPHHSTTSSFCLLHAIRAPPAAVVPFYHHPTSIVPPYNDTRGDELADPFIFWTTYQRMNSQRKIF